MDDGCLVKNRGFKFATNCFTLAEIKFVASILNSKYNLNTSIHKTGVNNQYNIYIPKTSLNDLVSIVKPHVHPTMYYKINIKP